MSMKALFRKNSGATPNGGAPEAASGAPAPSAGNTARKAKRKKRWIILGILVLLIAALLVNCSIQGAKVMSQAALSDTIVLSRSDIQNSVSATGTVESASSHTVYSTQSYPVQVVHVEVGDIVQEGDLLCELDASTLIDQIEAQELATGLSAKAAAQQVKTARDSYNASKDALDNGLNSSLISAENAVQNAYDAWQKAKRTYDQYTDNDSATLIKAQTEYENAERSFKATEKALPASPSSLELAALENARSNMEAAEKVLDATYDGDSSTAKEYKRAIETAYNAYVTAQLQFEAAQKSADTQLQSSKNALSSAQINGNTDSAVLKLAQMQADLEETRIKATASGTVTAVYAKVGANGAGLLFVIEDVDDLIIETSVSGYDVGDVAVGMPVSIKSDATGDTLINGKVTSIAPTSKKNSLGQSDASSEVLFDTEVAVLDQNTGLRIGMSVRLNYILEQQTGIISVPFDAIYEKDGLSYILCAKPQQNGKYLLEELPVSTGLEDNLNIVVTGDGVQEGLIVFSSLGNYRALIGREIELVDKAQAVMGRPGVFMAQG